jgi:hypothetical protein
VCLFVLALNPQIRRVRHICWLAPVKVETSCSGGSPTSWKITLPEDNEQILAARYLPTEEELRAELARERDEAERALRLAAAEGKVAGSGSV